MRIAFTKSGESLDDLAKRVYSFTGTPSKAHVRAAVQVLSETNPLLRKLSEVQAGTHLVVPALDTAKPSDQTQPFETAGAAALLGGLRVLIDQAMQSLQHDVTQDLAETASSASLLRSRELKRQASDANATGLLKETEVAAKQRTADAKRLQSYHQEVLLKIEDDLKELHSVLGQE